MSLLKLKNSPESLSTDKVEKIILSCELRALALWPFIENCRRLGIPADSWPSQLPFWILTQVYGDINNINIRLDTFTTINVKEEDRYILKIAITATHNFYDE